MLEGRVEMMGKRGRRRKQLLDALKEKGGILKFKEETLDRTLWESHYGKGCGPVARHTRKKIERKN
jgi:predicted nucleic acid-binding Zn ribbon protein